VVRFWSTRRIVGCNSPSISWRFFHIKRDGQLL
jgi:hypothetical protein